MWRLPSPHGGSVHGECGHCCCYFLASFTPRGECESKVAFFKPFQVSFPLSAVLSFLRACGGQRGWRSSGEGRSEESCTFFLPEFPGMCSLLKEKGDELVWRHQDAGGDIKTSERKRELKGCLCFLGVLFTTPARVCVRKTAFCFWNTSRGPPSLERHITGKWARGQRTFLGDLQTSSVCVWDYYY